MGNPGKSIRNRDRKKMSGNFEFAAADQLFSNRPVLGSKGGSVSSGDTLFQDQRNLSDKVASGFP
jgi:hypothetical protein